MRRLVVGPLLLVVGVAVATGAGLSSPGWAHVLRTSVEVLVFLVAAKLLADASDAVGLFGAVADRAARAARGSTALLFAAYVGVAIATTVLLSLDTTAVLLTPIGLALARRCRLNARPFAYASVWLANAASLLLPVSNLTNLMVVGRYPGGPIGFVAHLARPQAAVVAVVVAALVLRWRGSLRGRHTTPAAKPVTHPRLVAVAVAAVGVLAVGPLVGAPAWAAATAGALLLLGAAAITGHPVASLPRLVRLVPGQLCLLVVGLFLLVQVAVEHLQPPLWGGGVAGRLTLAGVGVAGSWVLTNLAALLALAPVAPDPSVLSALLVGVNVGPNVVLWAWLANLLWAERCRVQGLRIGVGEFAREGLWVTVPAVVVGALVA